MKIYIHPRCINFINEIQGYKYREDKDGNVYISGGDSLIKLDASGEIVWTKQAEGAGLIAASSCGQFCYLIAHASPVDSTLRLHKVNAGDGTTVWTGTDTVAASYMFEGTDENIYLTSNALSGANLQKFNSSGVRQWTVSARLWDAVLHSDGYLYAATRSTNVNLHVYLKRFDPADGAELWSSQSLGGGVQVHHLFSVEGVLYVWRRTTNERTTDIGEDGFLTGLYYLNTGDDSLVLVKEFLQADIEGIYVEEYEWVQSNHSPMIFRPSTHEEGVQDCIPDFSAGADYHLYAIGTESAFINKIDKAGKTVWTRYSVFSDQWVWDEAVGLDVDSNGNVFASSSIEGEVVKLDADGDEVWALNDEQGAGYLGYSFLKVIAGNDIVLGTEHFAVSAPATVIKRANSNGAEIWRNGTDFGSDVGDFVGNIQEDDSGNIYVCHYLADSGTVHLTKLDSDGDLVSTVQIDVVDAVNPENDFSVYEHMEASDTRAIPMLIYNNSIYIGGWGKSDASTECPQYRVYNASLAETARVSLSDAGTEQVHDIAVDSSGNVFVHTRYPHDDGIQKCNIFKFNSSGAEQARNNSFYDGWNVGFTLCVAPDGDVYSHASVGGAIVIRWHGSDLEQYPNWAAKAAQSYPMRLICGV
jgi:hypothetical protein